MGRFGVSWQGGKGQLYTLCAIHIPTSLIPPYSNPTLFPSPQPLPEAHKKWLKGLTFAANRVGDGNVTFVRVSNSDHCYDTGKIYI